MTRRSAPRSPARSVLALLLLLPVLLPAHGFAHDLWILPGKYRLAVDEAARVFVNNGDVFPESLTLLGEPRLSEVVSVSSAGELPITEFRVDGKSLTFDFRSRASGTHVIALGTRPRTVRMSGADFDDYLAEEGLSEAAALRRDLAQTGAPAVERYTKWAKAIVDVVDVGDESGPEGGWAVSAGQTFEIVPQDHPNRVRPGGSLRLRVLLDGEPIAGVRIVGSRASGPAREIVSSTDERGDAEVKVTAPGRWHVRAIHMFRVEGDPEVSWESYWATLTFEVKSATGSGR